MKKIYIKYLLNITCLFQLLSLTLLLFLPNSSYAGEVKFNPQVTVGEFTKGQEQPINEYSIGEYVKAVYKYAIGAVGILATVVMMMAGVIWMLAAGNPERVADAKTWITGAITGLGLALSSYAILYLINPDLVNFRPIVVPKIEPPKEAAGRAQPASCAWEKSPCEPGKDNIVSMLKSAHTLACSNEDKSDEGLICCCNFGGGWSYDIYIGSQMNDADPSLKSLLACMREKLPVGVGKLSSISDSDANGNSLLATCQDNYNKPDCEHSKNSCHYGGGVSKKSLAADFGDEQYGAIIIKAASLCGGKPLDEGNHIHVSTASCPHL